MKILVLLLFFSGAFAQSENELLFGEFWKQYHLSDSTVSVTFAIGDKLPVVSHKQYEDHHGYTFYYRGKKYEATQAEMFFSDDNQNLLDSLSDVQRKELDKNSWLYSTKDIRHNEALTEAAKLRFLDVKKQGIALSVKRIEYTYHLPDESFYIVNLSKKTIKYIWYTLVAYNAVDDYLGTKTIKQIGPIKYESWDYVTEDLFYNPKYTDRVDLKSIKVQYMDGTIKVITNPIKKCSIAPEQLNLATNGRIVIEY